MVGATHLPLASTAVASNVASVPAAVPGTAGTLSYSSGVAPSASTGPVALSVQPITFTTLPQAWVAALATGAVYCRNSTAASSKYYLDIPQTLLNELVEFHV